MKAVVAAAVAAMSLVGCAHLDGPPNEVKRTGMVTQVKPEKIAEYVDLHENAWPEVLAAMEECNIRNFSIYLGEIDSGRHVLFAYWEYWGDDFDADMAKMQTYPINEKWWALTDACQEPVPTHQGEGRWMSMEEVFHSK